MTPPEPGRDPATADGLLVAVDAAGNVVRLGATMMIVAVVCDRCARSIPVDDAVRHRGTGAWYCLDTLACLATCER